MQVAIHVLQERAQLKAEAEAVAAAKELAKKRVTITIDLLGRQVHNGLLTALLRHTLPRVPLLS